MADRITQCRERGIAYIGIPSGSLGPHTERLLRDAQLLTGDLGRAYEIPSTVAGVVFKIRDRIDMGRLVVSGVLDAGITGTDYLEETGCLRRVEPIADFLYSKQTRKPSRLVLASDPKVCAEIAQCRGRVIASELPRVTRTRLVERFGFGPKETRILTTHGKTETAVRDGRADAFGTLMESNPKMVGNRRLLRDPTVVRRIEEVATRLNAALRNEVQPVTLLSFNAPSDRLEEICAAIPTAKAADIVKTRDDRWVSITTQVPREGLMALMYQLLALGADDIVDTSTGFMMDQSMIIRYQH
jgi:ATP phosphoribosyltransferase